MAGKSIVIEDHTAHWVSVTLAERSGKNPDAIQIADATIAVWYEITMPLKAIIGRQGVAALYNRSVALAARAYPWLASSRIGDDHSVDLDRLQSVIARQNIDDAAKGACQLLETFYNVLVSLIGPALSEQLLASVREKSASSRPRDP
jgi:hypothetical protein